MRLKFISDGTQEGTRVVNAATGELVEGIQNIAWEHTVDSTRMLKLEIALADADIKLTDKNHGTVHYFTCPLSSTFPRYHEKLQDGEGNAIGDIYGISVYADHRGIRMQLKQVEDLNSIKNKAHALWSEWNQPHEATFNTVSSLVRK